MDLIQLLPEYDEREIFDKFLALIQEKYKKYKRDKHTLVLISNFTHRKLDREQKIKLNVVNWLASTSRFPLKYGANNLAFVIVTGISGNNVLYKCPSNITIHAYTGDPQQEMGEIISEGLLDD